MQPWPQVAAADKAAVMGVLERGVLWGAAAPEATALQEEWAAYVGRAPLPGDEQRYGGSCTWPWPLPVCSRRMRS